ncbi:MAG: hypothetical protein Q8O89_05935, partial [Nanoarchaeota archaeon]|nr:hypothetical protein [Nanoarchaeota archaeon]
STTTPASQNTGIQGTETTKNSAPDGTQATDTSSVDQLNQDLNTADIDNIDVTVDESTFS